MIDKSLIQLIAEQEESLKKELRFVSDFLYKNPEIGMKEYLASDLLSGIAENHGFTVTRNFCGMETAFLAEFRNGSGPTIAFLAEYDALPGFGPEGKPGHACGHNWIAATTVGAALVLSKLSLHFQGTIQLIGSPGMENYGGKVDMVRAHVFDTVDAAIQPHLEQHTSLDCRSLALDAIQFNFKGRASHSAIYAQEGVNALDAVQFMFIGVNALKNHLRRDAKIHGIITSGGETPSVITENASCRFYIRALNRSYLNTVTQKVIRCAEGAALMAGAEMVYEPFENPCDDLINNKVLQDIMREYMDLEEIPITYTYQEISASFASDDIGSVSYVCPSLYVEFDMEAPGEFRIHDATAMKYVNSELSYHKMDQAVRILAGSAMELFLNPDKVKNARLELRKTLAEKIF